MIRTGLVSITFRRLSPEDIVALVAKAGLDGIEWGGDIHVPHGNRKMARQVAALTQDNGLGVAAYGSYYRVGCQGENGVPSFEAVLDTAVELGAPLIRVWAGDRGSAKSDEVWRNQVVEDSRRIADMAGEQGIVISYEYHGDTLTDTLESTRWLLKEVQHPNIKSYWQPLPHHDKGERLEGLEQVMPWLSNLHVFHWVKGQRCPLEEGVQDWTQYLNMINNTLKEERFALIEFVKDDEPEQFLKDGMALKKWVQGL